MKNRIAKYYPEFDGDNFEHVEFEKFDPTIIQRVIKTSIDEEDDDDAESYESLVSQAQKIQVSPDNQLFRTLDLWIGHCDINITEELMYKLQQVEGVETLDIMTRYRFRLGVGKRFKANKVKAEISKTINEHLQKKK